MLLGRLFRQRNLSRSFSRCSFASKRNLACVAGSTMQLSSQKSPKEDFNWFIIAAASGVFGSTIGTALAEEQQKPKTEAQALTNNPMEYDPITNEHTAKMTMARSAALEYYQSGKYEKAEIKFVEALEEAKLGFDAKDPHIASCKNNLAEFYRNTGQYDKAEKYYLEALEQLEAIYGEKHWLFVSAMHNLALMYESRGDLPRARSYMDRVLRLRRTMFGPRHFLYADSLFGLAHILKKTGGKDKEAIQLMKDAIKILEEEESVQTPVVVAWLLELTAEYRAVRKFADAAAAVRKALFHLGNEKGEETAAASQLSDELVEILLVLKKREEARDVLTECLAARKAIFGAQQLVVAQTANRLAQLELELRRPEDSLAHYATASDVSRAVLAGTRTSKGWFQGILGSAISNTTQKQLQAAHILATSLKATAELILAPPRRDAAAAVTALHEAVDEMASALASASAVIKAVQSGRALPEGLDPAELSALIVEVQLLTIECLERLQEAISAAGGADVDRRLAAVEVRLEELSQVVLAMGSPSSQGQGQDKKST